MAYIMQNGRLVRYYPTEEKLNTVVEDVADVDAEVEKAVEEIEKENSVEAEEVLTTVDPETVDKIKVKKNASKAELKALLEGYRVKFNPKAKASELYELLKPYMVAEEEEDL